MQRMTELSQSPPEPFQNTPTTTTQDTKQQIISEDAEINMTGGIFFHTLYYLYAHTLYSLLSNSQTLNSQLSTLNSLLSTLYFLLPTPYSLLSTPYSLLSTLYSQLSYSLMSHTATLTLTMTLTLTYSTLAQYYTALAQY